MVCIFLFVKGVEVILQRSKKYMLWEVLGVTIALLVISRILTVFRSVLLIDQLLPLFIAIMFLYAPNYICQWRKRRLPNFVDQTVHDYMRSFYIASIAAIIVFPLFFIGVHMWQSFLFPTLSFTFQLLPDVLLFSLYQVILVALPEEYYFRGYFQTSLNAVFEKKWRILGVHLGWSWIITSIVFAFAHTMITFRWWHFSIFFPGLLFGYLREKTGRITASIICHALSNILMNLFVYCYQ